MDHDRNKAYFLQPFLHGKTLHSVIEENLAKLDKTALNKNDMDYPDKLKKQVLNNMDVLIKHMRISTSFLKAIKEMHKKNIIHCDLHAGNVLYDSISEQTKIIDLGMAHILNAGNDKIIVKGVHPLEAFHLSQEMKELSNETIPQHIYSKLADLYAFAYSAFMDKGVIDTIKDSPLTKNLVDICEKIDNYYMSKLFRFDQTDRARTVSEALVNINARDSVDKALLQFENFNRQLADARKQFAILPPNTSASLLHEANLKEHQELQSVIVKRKLMISQLKTSL